MSCIYPVEAYAYASRFLLREVEGWLPRGRGVVAGTGLVRAEPPAGDGDTRSPKTELLVELGENKLAYLFDFGTLVLINVPDEEREKIVERFNEKLPNEPHAPLRESFLIEVRPGAGVEVQFDRVVIGDVAPDTMAVIATVVAQSVAIDYYDEDVQAILDRIGAVARELSRQGRPMGKTRDFMRFVGAAMASQIEIIAAISLLDKPDTTWESEVADRLHEKLRSNLEIQERYKALETKLSTVRESLQTLIELSQTRRMLFLEGAIVALIVLEILLGLMKLS